MKTLRRLTTVMALFSAGAGALHFFRARFPAALILSVPKVFAEALAPFLALAGVISGLMGLVLGMPAAVLAGTLGGLFSASYVRRVLAARADFSVGFGADWRARILPPPGQRVRLLPQRWGVGLPAGPPPRFEQDVVFWTLPTGRDLLCDVWQPPEGIPASGLAFIYLHGSAWHYGDKDELTRPMFRHLARQGHVIVDVAYRLCPETDWRGMLYDVKHAIAWIKTNADRYGVDPARVVVAGGSAGAHLALLAAYTASRRDLAPPDLEAADLSVRGVVSWYGPTDLLASHTRAAQMSSSRAGVGGRRLGERWLRNLLGGTANEIPAVYREASPRYHVHPGCPPTLLLYGEHDSLVAPTQATALARALKAAGVPMLHVQYPQTEHAFDLVLPQVSPVAQNALYEAERFLALMAWG